MERRRYVPSTEGLEGRMLLSASGGGTAAAAGTTAAAAVSARQSAANNSSTVHEKELRIERLPYFLSTFQPGRVLPPETMARLQADLLTILGRLNPPPSAVLDEFNTGLRAVIPGASLSAEDARRLNGLFGNVLDAAGAPPRSVSALQEDMNQLMQADSNSRNPVMLATNDYALVLQTALAVGRPIKAPTLPKIAKADRVRGLGPHTTANHQPSLSGTYDAGHTMQVVEADSDVVLGTGPVASDGTYTVPLSHPLADGTYKVRLIAIDAEGRTSDPSRIYTFKIITR